MTENTRPEDLNGENSLDTPKKGEITMSSAEKEQKRISRREFVKGAAVGAAGAAATGALAACGPTPTPEVIKETVEVEKVVEKEVTVEVIKEVEVQPWLPEKWDYEADVVVLGAGGAGWSAAYEAADAGAKVILLEKMPTWKSAASVSCGGWISAWGTSVQKAAGTTDDSADLYYNDLIKADPRANPRVMRVLADNVTDTVELLNELGMTWQDWSCEPTDIRSGHSRPRTHASKPNAWKYGEVMEKAVKGLGVQILYNTRGVELIRDCGENGVVGVKAEDMTTKNALTFKARRAVILCTGDQSSGAKVKAKYGPPGPWIDLPGRAGGAYGNLLEGDGIIMGHAIGADHTCMENDGAISLSDPQFVCVSTNREFIREAILGGVISVNKDGKRFADETGDRKEFSYKQLEQPEQVSFWICDDVFAKKNLMSNDTWTGGRYFQDWIALGIPTIASTIEELAGKFGISAAGLKAEVDKYNGYAAAASDPDFGRLDLGPGIKVPPFYGLGPCRIMVGNMNATLMIVPETFQVVDVFGEVIPRLYAAGDNGKAGKIPLGGCHMGLAFTAGRIAGKHAAALAPWG